MAPRRIDWVRRSKLWHTRCTLPAILREVTGVAMTQSALTQDALKQAAGPVGAAYREARQQVRHLHRRHELAARRRRSVSDGLSTPAGRLFQIRSQHGNEQVREPIPRDYRGIPMRNAAEVVNGKTGRAKTFGSELKTLLQQANELSCGGSSEPVRFKSCRAG